MSTINRFQLRHDTILPYGGAKNCKDLPFCNDDLIATYLADLQAINPESILYSTAGETPDTLCEIQSVHLVDLKTYLSTCRRPSDSDLYAQLLKGELALYRKLCLDEDFKKQFQQSWPCLHEMREDFQDCNGPEDWTENSDSKQVCVTYTEIMDCFYIKTAKMCGTVTAKMMDTLTEVVISNVITVSCTIPLRDYKSQSVNHDDSIDSTFDSQIKAECNNMLLHGVLYITAIMIFLNFT